MLFSQRIGKTPLTKEIQIEKIDTDLKNRLWNLYNLIFLEGVEDSRHYRYDFNSFATFSTNLWHNFFKLPIVHIPYDKPAFSKWIFEWFLSAGRYWYELYNLIDYSYFIFNSDYRYDFDKENAQNLFNNVLEQEFSGYRFINGQLCPITNNIEIKAIEETLQKTNNNYLKSVNIHIERSLQLLSDRKSPDYRNSIKESISAVESICKIISSNNSATLGDALIKIKSKIDIHSALINGFKNIYGYTSDSSGIRHSLTDLPDCHFEDAHYMLISCSAFINYLLLKANKAGILINK